MSSWIPFWLGGQWDTLPNAHGVESAILRKVLSDGVITGLIGDQMMLSDPPNSPTFPLIEFFLLIANEDPDVPRRGETVRITPWAKSRDVVDTLAERLIAILHRQPIDIVDSRLASVRLLAATPQDDTAAHLFSKALDFRIVTYPA